MFVQHKHPYTYISRSIPSLYGRLDFFQSTAFSSHTIRELLGCSKGGLSYLSHSPTRAFVFCLAYPTRRGPSYFVSHPLVVTIRTRFTSFLTQPTTLHVPYPHDSS